MNSSAIKSSVLTQIEAQCCVELDKAARTKVTVSYQLLYARVCVCVCVCMCVYACVDAYVHICVYLFVF